MTRSLAPSDAPAIDARDLVKTYGGVTALSRLSLNVGQGETFGIIGPNGAGKSTLFDVLCGLNKPTSGSVRIMGHDVTKLRPHELPKLGVARTFQRTALFAGSTVQDNLFCAMHLQFTHSVFGRMVGSTAYRRDMRCFKDQAERVLALTHLDASRHRIAGALAYGEQRRLAVAIVLMLEPAVIFLDEPVAGMNGRESAEFVDLIRRIAPGRTILIVEHDMAVVKELCGRVLAMAGGKPLVVNTPDAVLRHPDVLTAYLGSDDD